MREDEDERRLGSQMSGYAMSPRQERGNMEEVLKYGEYEEEVEERMRTSSEGVEVKMEIVYR